MVDTFCIRLVWDDRPGCWAVRGEQVELTWTGWVGPSGIVVLRRCAWLLDRCRTAGGGREELELPAAELARSVGLSVIRLAKTIDRLERFGLVAREANVVGIRRFLPAAPRGHDS